MKHIKLMVGFLLTMGFCFAQTDELNLKKYWKLRNDLREDFMKIGPDPGESLPARSIRPLDCADNDTISTAANQTPLGRPAHGEMHFGDGMIRQGYYLGLLATEFRLLKDAGEDVTGVLNELYFALKAINRIDLSAEQVLGPLYNVEYPQNLNGFYLREDIPENFAYNNWGHANIEARCVNSPMYKTNNAMHIDDGGYYFAEANSYQNVPSMDQFSSLMLGFSLIHKLVDNEFVIPPGEPEGIYIINETKNIVNRMMGYIVSRNWMMIDVNGWPVANQGGDCIGVSYPLYEAAKRITGQNYTSWGTRKTDAYLIEPVQFCLTGFGKDNDFSSGQQEACDDLTFLQETIRGELLMAVPPGTSNNQDNSIFMNWLSAGNVHLDPQGVVKNMWRNETVNVALDFLEQYGLEVGSPYVKVLIANCGVASGVWSQSRLNQFIQTTGNKELYLINAVIRDETPMNSQAFYKCYLDSMTPTGPFNLWTGLEGVTSGIHKAAANGWGSDLKWTQDDELYGSPGETGIFNGIDYMLFHNLYYLIYKNSLPKFNVNQDCLCENIQPLTGTTYPGATSQNYVAARDRVNLKLTFLNTCTENAFQPVNNNVTGTFQVEPYFPNYADMNIFPAKFLAVNSSIAATGTVNVRTLFKLCNGKTLTIQNGGKMNIEKSETQVGLTSTIDNSGVITVKSGTKLIIDGKLILKGTSKLIIENGGTVILNSTSVTSLEYYNGAQIIMNGPNSRFIIGGAIKIKDLADFNIIQTGATCGQVIFTSQAVGLTADNPNATYTFTGSGKNVPYITIKANSRIWVMNNFAKKISFINASVVFEDGASIRCDQIFNAHSSKFSATGNNGGILLSEGSYFSNSELVNIPVLSDFTLEGIGILESYSTDFITNSALISAPYVVKIIGRGYKIKNADILGIKDYCLYTKSQNLASTIEGSTIGYNGTLPTGNLITGMYDYSNNEVIIRTSTISRCHLGIQKRQGTLTLRCDKFELNRDINIQPQDGCVLNMNSTHLGGFNQLLKTINNKNIYLWASGFTDIKSGYNFIEYIPGSTITGSVFTYCSTCPTLDVSGNQWNSSNSVPTNVGTVYTQVAQNTLSWTISPVALKQTCPLEGVPAEKSLKTAVALIYSDIENDSIALDNAIYKASSYMSYYNDTTPDDLRAMARLDEVLSAQLDKSNPEINEWLWFATSQMKTALESAYSLDLLSSENNTGAFDPVTEKYVHALMYMNDSLITPENYSKQFYHEMDKAHLLRLTGHTDLGLHILEELESCGIDSVAQSQLNYWKTVYQNEVAIEALSVSTFDTIISSDTTGFINPELTINNYSFGAVIYDLNSIVYPNCTFFNSRELMMVNNSKQLGLYPNPAAENVTLQIISDVDGKGSFTISQPDGRKVFSRDLDILARTEFDWNVSDWMAGMYNVTVTYPDGKTLTKRLIIK